jgi:hypothetical protein
MASRDEEGPAGQRLEELMSDAAEGKRNILKGMRHGVRLMAICALLLLPRVVLAQGKFDGN